MSVAEEEVDPGDWCACGTWLPNDGGIHDCECEDDEGGDRE